MKLRSLLAFFLVLLCSLAWAKAGPHAGSFTVVDTSGLDVKQYTIVLTPSKSGDFTVSGPYSEGRGRDQKITGILHRKTGRLNAKVHKEGDPFALDGYWSTNDNVLVIQAGRNLVTKEDRRDSGDDWVIEAPVIESHGDVVGAAGTITVTNKVDGKTGTATVTFSGIPRRVRDGERVKITLKVTNTAPGRATAGINQNCVGKMIVNDGSVSTDGGGKPNGTLEFDFRGGSGAYIQISGGIDPPGRWALVTFKYHKARP